MKKERTNLNEQQKQYKTQREQILGDLSKKYFEKQYSIVLFLSYSHACWHLSKFISFN